MQLNKEQQEKMLEDKMRRAVIRMRSDIIAWYYYRWVDDVSAQKRERAMLKRAAQLWYNRQLVDCFRRWVSMTRDAWKTKLLADAEQRKAEADAALNNAIQLREAKLAELEEQNKIRFDEQKSLEDQLSAQLSAQVKLMMTYR